MEKANKKPTKFEEMTKEQIRQAILKKKECNTKAQEIVESLIESRVSESYLLQCLPDINQAHFDDVVEERSISHLCGYPLCGNSIAQKDVPKQKFRISMKTNKVYDITARKSYCSNGCYKAAVYVKKQMLTSPLWFREYEVIPTFQILPMDSSGSMGQEIDVSIITKVQTGPENRLFTSINDFAAASLNDMHDDDLVGHDNDERPTPIVESETPDQVIHSQGSDPKRNSSAAANKEISITAEKLSNLTIEEHEKPAHNPMNIVGDIVEKPERQVDPILFEKPHQTEEVSKPKKLQIKQPLVKASIIEVEKCLAQWFTLDTLVYLYGLEQVRGMFTEKGNDIKEYLNSHAQGMSYSINSCKQYRQLCEKLKMLEIEDRQHKIQALERETKPLPDYSKIQEESKDMQLKVKAFLSGETAIPETLCTRDESIPDEENKLTQLPLIDKNAPNAIRRRIVYQHLNNIMPDLLTTLEFPTLTITSDVRLLVNTFKLDANNIMFKPLQWTLIAIVVVRLLAIKNKQLQVLLKYHPPLQSIMLHMIDDDNPIYIIQLVAWLTNIDRLLDTSETQLTKEEVNLDFSCMFNS